MGDDLLPILPAIPAFVVEYNRDADGSEHMSMRFESTDADAVHGVAVEGFSDVAGMFRMLRGATAKPLGSLRIRGSD